MFAETTKGPLLALGLGLIGWLAFAGLQVPVAALCGPAVFVAVAATWGLPVRFPKAATGPLFIALGIVLGDAADPALIGAIGTWPLSLLAMALTMTAILVAVSRYLERAGGCDRPTAVFAAIPGALTLSLILAEAAGAKMATVAIVQSVRLLILIALLPPLIALVDPSVIGAGFSPGPLVPGGLLMTVAAGLAGAGIARLLRVPAAGFTGAMIGAGLVSGSGLAAGTLPVPAANAAMLALGILTGTRFAGIALREVVATLKISLIAFVIGGTIALAASALVAGGLGLPFGQVLLALAPGGLEAMTVLALVMGFDPVYVALHHMVRMLAMSLTLPWVGRWLTGGGRPPGRNGPPG